MLKMAEIIYKPGSLRHYRADCLIGQFKIGSDQLMGNEMWMEVLTWRVIEGELFNYPFQRWVQVIFIDFENVVSSILFKGRSLRNFFNLVNYLETETPKRKVQWGNSLATMESMISSIDYKQYFQVQFCWQQKDESRINELREFMKEKWDWEPELNCSELSPGLVTS